MTKKSEQKLTGINEVLHSLQLHVKVKKGQYNKFGRYKYRTAEDILLAVKEELKKDIYPQDSILLTNVELKEILNRLFVCVTATLRVGKEEFNSQGLAEHAQNKKGMDEAQLTGATITYARKYALQNLFGIDESEEDIDSKDNTQDNKPTNQFQQLHNATSGDMQQMQEDNNQKQFVKLKNDIESCGSVDEVAAIWEQNKTTIAQLKKYANHLFDMLVSSKEAMKDVLDPEAREEVVKVVR